MSEQVCVLIEGDGDVDFGLVGVTDPVTAEEWRKKDTTRRAYQLFSYGKILDQTSEIKHVVVIDEFVPAEDCDPVRVIIRSSDDWSKQKAEQLIRAAKRMYEALNDAIQHISAVDPNWDGLIALERAEAMARGGMLQGDRIARKGNEADHGKARTVRNH